MKNTTSITTTISTTKTKNKSSFKAKTRIVAMVLTIITALSVLTVSIGSVSAAENTAKAASNSSGLNISTKDLISGVSTSVVTKAIDIATKDNPVEAVLCSGVSTVYKTLFGSLLGGGDDKILSCVKEISTQIQNNHNEEMEALSKIQKTLEDLKDKIDMQPFNSSYRNMNNFYDTVFNYITYSSISDDITLDEDNPLIDKDTYDAYSDILTKVGFKTSMDIDVQFNDMYKYLTTDDTFSKLVNIHKNQLERTGLVSWDELEDFHSIEYTIQQIESDMVLYYTAYLTLIQMNYQCKNYEKNSGADEYKAYPTKGAVNQMSDLAEKMSEINDAFTSACNLIDDLTTASLTVNGTTKYFTFTPIAWSTAATLGKEYDDYNGRRAYDMTFKLYKDWVAPSADVGMAMKKECLSWEGFDSKYGTLNLYLKSRLLIDLTEYAMDGRKLNSKVSTNLLNATVWGDGGMFSTGYLELLVRKDKTACMMPTEPSYMGWYTVSDVVIYGKPDSWVDDCGSCEHYYYRSEYWPD